MTYSNPKDLIKGAEDQIEGLLKRFDRLTPGNVVHEKAGMKMCIRHLKEHHLDLLKKHLGFGESE